MSAHAYAPPTVAPERDRQPRLFALPGGAEADSPQRPIARSGAPLTALSGGLETVDRSELPGPATVAAAAIALAPARRTAEPAAARAARTLDAEVRLAWTAIAAGAPAACLLCDGRMVPNADATGAACTSCGTTLE